MDQKSLFGVYAITNRITGASYIGSTTRTFRSREKDHWTKLGLGCHKNQRLTRAWAKYGPDAFEFRIIEVISHPADVIAREQYYLDIHFGADCYNVRPNAESNRGWNPSEETRRAMSRAGKGRRQSDQTRAIISEKTQGLVRNPWTAESRRKLSEAKRGKPRPPEVVAAMVASNKMRCQDPEYVEKITGHFRTEEMRERIREARQKTFAGVFVSPDGTEFRGVVNLSRFCKEHGLTISSMSQLAAGKLRHHKSWIYRDAGTS